MVKKSFLYDTQKELLVYAKCHPVFLLVSRY